jgi:Rps23 Pro-64 3,4-dihydroxylase Tpa1-like proline 4-hydroxylase
MNEILNQIKVFDNFFTLDIQEKILQSLERPNWSYNGGDRYTSPFWHMRYLEKEDFYSNFLLDKIETALNMQFDVINIYANGQTAGQYGSPHIDTGDYTFLYYPVPNWDITMGGSLFFLNVIGENNAQNSEVIKTISYKGNRAVFFPTQISHLSEAPERHCNLLRLSVAWKLNVKKNKHYY